MKIILRGLLLLAAGSPLALTGSLILYNAPDANSEQLGSSVANSPDLTEARPVDTPGLATQGWFTAEYRSMITGFVSDAEIGKDLLPVENAPVLESPDPEASVLTTYQDGQEIEILDRGLFWKVRISMILPVYYQVKPQVTSGTQEPAGPGTGTGLVFPQSESPGESKIERPALDSGGLVSSRRQGSRLAPIAMRSQPFEGVFKQARGTLGIGRPRFAYMLEDSDGKRIAWVDHTQMLFTGAFPDFLNRRVVIFGDWDTDLNPRDRVIIGRNMRLAPTP